MYRINEFIDGVVCNLAIATFDNLSEADDFVNENNAQPGGHVYGIDPEDLPETE